MLDAHVRSRNFFLIHLVAYYYDCEKFARQLAENRFTASHHASNARVFGSVAKGGGYRSK